MSFYQQQSNFPYSQNQGSIYQNQQQQQIIGGGLQNQQYSQYNNNQIQLNQVLRQEEPDLYVQSKADLKPEIYYIGQIVGAEDFNTSDGLLCEIQIDISKGSSWEMLSQPPQIQTQTSYAEPGSMYVWNHPIDICFAVNDINSWPKLALRIWKLDSSNKIDCFAYGCLTLPMKNGFNKLVCQTWAPTGQKGTENFRSYEFFLGNQPKLQSMDVVTKTFQDVRDQLYTVSSGKVIVELDCIMKNFDKLDISGQQQS